MEMNLDAPDLPSEIIPVDMPEYFETECFVYWRKIVEELRDPTYINRTHGNTGTHDKGCRGPLCRKGYREHPRRKKAISAYAPREQRIFDPIIEYYALIAKKRIKEIQYELARELSA